MKTSKQLEGLYSKINIELAAINNELNDKGLLYSSARFSEAKKRIPPIIKSCLEQICLSQIDGTIFRGKSKIQNLTSEVIIFINDYCDKLDKDDQLSAFKNNISQMRSGILSEVRSLEEANLNTYTTKRKERILNYYGAVVGTAGLLLASLPYLRSAINKFK